MPCPWGWEAGQKFVLRTLHYISFALEPWVVMGPAPGHGQGPGTLTLLPGQALMSRTEERKMGQVTSRT